MLTLDLPEKVSLTIKTPLRQITVRSHSLEGCNNRASDIISSEIINFLTNVTLTLEKENNIEESQVNIYKALEALQITQSKLIKDLSSQKIDMGENL